jgi:large subunit ribosomal protein L32e
MTEEYASMTVAQLKELLKEQGLPVSGKKAELIERLMETSGAEEEEVVEDTVEESTGEDDFFEEDEDWDNDEDEVHVAKQKPVLDEETQEALSLRAAQKKKTPSFRRTEWFRYKRLSRSGWRAPHGMDSKQRRNYRYRGSLVRVGHGKVAEARGLHPSGFREVMVHNINDLEPIDPETQAARIGRTVGNRKREHIHARADELGIRILNRRSGV